MDGDNNIIYTPLAGEWHSTMDVKSAYGLGHLVWAEGNDKEVMQGAKDADIRIYHSSCVGSRAARHLGIPYAMYHCEPTVHRGINIKHDAWTKADTHMCEQLLGLVPAGGESAHDPVARGEDGVEEMEGRRLAPPHADRRP